MNKSYGVNDYAPGLFLFGSDGGGEAFAFDARSDAKPIVSVPFIGMELKLARPVASNFSARPSGFEAAGCHLSRIVTEDTLCRRLKEPPSS